MPKNTKTNVKSNNAVSKKQSVSVNPIRSVLASLAVGIAVMLCSSLALAFILSKTSDPDAFTCAAAIMMNIAGGLGCGICCTKLSGRSLPYSIIGSFVMLAVYLVISLFFDETEFMAGTVFKIISTVSLPLSAVIGGFLAERNRGTKNKKRGH